MKKLFFLLFLGSSTICKSQDSTTITIGSVHKTYSNILKEERQYFIYLPESATNDLYEKQKYPVIYLLDGEQHFKGLAGIMESMSSMRVFPEAIVVAIPNIDRIRDFTPTHITSGIFLDSASAISSGGGEKFTRFLKDELMPEIESKYSTAPYRILIGHSLGGLFATNTFLKHTELFNAYISIDPALWYDNSKLVKEANAILSNKNFTNTQIFISTADAFKEKLDTVKVRKSKTLYSDAVLAVPKLIDALKMSRNATLRWNVKNYKNEGHNTAPLISEYDGLHYIFKHYNLLSVDNEIFHHLEKGTAILKYLELQYKQISLSMGYKVLPSETLTNNLGYSFLRAKDFKSSYLFFQMNEKNYPNSFNVYDSFGDYYSAIGNKDEAKIYYKKAVKILAYPETLDKLKLLN